MADPSRYTQSYDFSGFQDSNPSTPIPAAQLDIQLADIATSTSSLRSAVMDIRRSDGYLKNGIVTPDSLSASLSLGFTLTGAWAEGQSYAAGDGVVYDETFYKARVSHTSSSSNRPDLDATRWDFLFTMAAIAVTDGSITPAKLESSQGEAFHAKIETATYMGPIIDGLTSKASPVSADSIAISDSAATAASKKLTLGNLASWLFSGLGALIAAATAKSTPVDADMLLIADSLDSNASKKTTVAALKTGMGLGTSGSPQFSSVEVGHATDTTLERAAAGFISVEGKRVPSPASQAQGDLLTRGSTEWERIAKGTALQSLRMNAGATTQEWSADVGIGAGQTWQDVTGSRTEGTSYQNTTGRTIQVAISIFGDGDSTAEWFQVSSDNSTWVGLAEGVDNSAKSHCSANIPSNWYYRVVSSSSWSIRGWSELR